MCGECMGVVKPCVCIDCGIGCCPAIVAMENGALIIQALGCLHSAIRVFASHSRSV